MTKLARLKKVVNRLMPLFGRACPKVEPTRNVTLLLARVFGRVRANLNVQDAEVQRAYSDKNFFKLMDVVEKVLVYIAEEDGHYRGQLAYLLLSVTGEVESAFKLKRMKDSTYTIFEFHKWLTEHPTELKKT